MARLFDFCIGNPPYQDETLGDNAAYAPPVYHRFIDASAKIADKSELIHPARFLFNAGSTPKAWNEKILNDPHFKVLYYEIDSKKVFPNTDIKGGVAVSLYDNGQRFAAIKVFSPYKELNSIMRKAAPVDEADSLAAIIYVQNKFNLEILYAEYPHYKAVIGSEGRDKRFRNNIFDKIDLFSKNKNNEDDVPVIGIMGNKRKWRYLPLRFLESGHENFDKWKVLVPRANGTGALGEILSTPLIGAPLIGYTQSFIGIGAFITEAEANNCLKYVKGKFSRCMLGILKITQDNNRDTWRMVPLQDFTSASDIDWSQSVADIDKQLYKKYALSSEEIAFIETHVKEME